MATKPWEAYDPIPDARASGGTGTSTDRKPDVRLLQGIKPDITVNAHKDVWGDASKITPKKGKADNSTALKKITTDFGHSIGKVDFSNLQGDVSHISGDIAHIRGYVRSDANEMLMGNVTTLEGNISGIYGNIQKEIEVKVGDEIKKEEKTISGDVSYLRGDVSRIWGPASKVEVIKIGPREKKEIPHILRGDVSHINGDITKVYGNAGRVSGDISNLSGDVSTLRGDVSGIKGTAERMPIVDGKSKEKKEKIIAKPKPLTGDMSHITGDISRIYGLVQKKMVYLTSEKGEPVFHGSFDNEIEDKELRESLAKEKIKNIRRINDGIEIVGDVSGIRGDISNISGNVSQIKGDVSRIRGLILGTLKGDVSNIIGDVSNIEGNPSRIRGNVTDISGDVSNISGDVSNLTGDVSRLNGDVSHLRGDVAGFTGDAQYVTGSVSYVTGDTTRLHGDVSHLRGDVSGLSGNATEQPGLSIPPEKGGVLAAMVEGFGKMRDGMARGMDMLAGGILRVAGVKDESAPAKKAPVRPSPRSSPTSPSSKKAPARPSSSSGSSSSKKETGGFFDAIKDVFKDRALKTNTLEEFYAAIENKKNVTFSDFPVKRDDGSERRIVMEGEGKKARERLETIVNDILAERSNLWSLPREYRQHIGSLLVREKYVWPDGYRISREELKYLLDKRPAKNLLKAYILWEATFVENGKEYPSRKVADELDDRISSTFNYGPSYLPLSVELQEPICRICLTEYHRCPPDYVPSEEDIAIAVSTCNTSSELTMLIESIPELAIGGTRVSGRDVALNINPFFLGSIPTEYGILDKWQELGKVL